MFLNKIELILLIDVSPNKNNKASNSQCNYKILISKDPLPGG